MGNIHKGKDSSLYRRMVESSAYHRFTGMANHNLFVFCCCGILGAIFFIWAYGLRILDFTYTGWLMNQGGDLTQHYLGWRFFRDSAWHFPIGLMDNIVFPFKESIIYTDSIPLFAFIFKLLSPILPAHFQYFGLFSIICYFLQGAVSGLILKRLCGNTLYAVIGSCFLILSTTMAYRIIIGHTSLAVHFIILLCIYVCVSKGSVAGSVKKVVVWSGISCLAATIHFYYVPVVFIFIFFDMLDDCIATKKPILPILRALLPVVLTVLCMAVMGAFYSGAGKSLNEMGVFSANLVSLFNPMGFSAFLKDLPMVTEGQHEGYGYLGLGVLLGCFAAVLIVFRNLHKIRTLAAPEGFVRRLILSMVLFAFFLILSLSPVVTYKARTLFTYPIPGIVREVWGFFRNTGRFIWIPAYMITFAVVWIIHRENKAKAAAVILLLLLLVQFQDVKGIYAHAAGGRGYINRIEWKTNLRSSAWNKLAERHQHIVVLGQLGGIQTHSAKLFHLASFANDHQMTTNDFYLARKDFQSVEEFKAMEIARLISGDVAGDTIYVFDPDQYEGFPTTNALVFYQIDDMIIGVKDMLDCEDEEIKRLN